MDCALERVSQSEGVVGGVWGCGVGWGFD